MKKVEKWQSRLKIRRYSTIILLVTFLLSLVFIGLTVYGTKSGNFIVNIAEESQVKLALSETPDFSQPTAYLYAKGLPEMYLCTYDWLPDTNSFRDGSDNDNYRRRYIAYTFYLKNYSVTAVDVTAVIDIIDVTKKVDSAIRVMVVTDNQTENIYAKAQEVGKDIGMPETGGEYETIPFVSEKTVMSQEFINFPSGSTIKFAVVIWLEGEDPQAVDDIKGGRLKMMMNFSGY